jgi:Domain of unknown function (DUF4349)
VTMIDEEELTRLLQQLGDLIVVSDAAEAAILEAATPEPRKARERQPKTALMRSMVPSSRKQKGSLVAALLVLLIAGGVSLAVALPNSSVSSPGANPALSPAQKNAPFGILSPSGPEKSAAGQRSSVGGSGGTGGSPGVLRASSGASTGVGAAGGGSRTTSPRPPGEFAQSAKVVANGTVDLTVKRGSLQDILADLTQLAASYGGFVASTQAQYGNTTPPSVPTGTIVLRIPEASFGSAVSQAQRFGQATSVNTTSTDVTGQYVNLQAQIAAAQASLTQYLGILRQATTIPNILTVQNQIDSIESNIEQMQGQLNVMNNETTYGTLTVSVTEPSPKHQKPKPKPKPISKPSGIENAWQDGIGGFVSGFEWFIRILGPLLIIALILGGILLIGTRAWRFARRRAI